MNKQKSINRRLKRGHLKMFTKTITNKVIERWETNPILGGIHPVYKDEETIKIELFRRSKRGVLIPA